MQTDHVISEAKDCWALVGFIGPNAFKHARAVVQRVSEDMHLGVSPINEGTIHPDLWRRRDRHRDSLLVKKTLSVALQPTTDFVTDCNRRATHRRNARCSNGIGGG